MKVNQGNEKIRVMIVEDEEKTGRSMLEFLGKETGIDICSFSTGGCDIFSEVKFYNPDVVITDFMAADINGKKVLEVINSELKFEKPKTIVTIDRRSVTISEESFKIGSDYYIKKPLTPSLLKGIIFRICGQKEREVPFEMNLRICIKNLLKSVGVPTNILGYRYMEDALYYMIESNQVFFLVEIYGKISCKYDTSLKCVEVSISNAIKKAKKFCNEAFREIFGFCGCNPGNSVFLSVLKEKIVVEDMNMWNII